MGHDIHIIGNHNLDISCMEALAKDISKRFKANVEFGYYDNMFDFDINGNTGRMSIEDNVLGKIDFPNASTTLWLNDEYYMYRAVLDKHGKEAYNLPYFKKHDGLHRQELDIAAGNIRYELRDNYEDNEYAVIFNDTIHDWYNSFNSRWWSFCKAFTIEDYDDLLQYEVALFRKEVLQFFEKVGGTEAFYFDDQGKSQYLTVDYYDWATILKEVETNFKETTLNIPEYMKGNKLNPWKVKPLAFYDDFSDLKLKSNQVSI